MTYRALLRVCTLCALASIICTVGCAHTASSETTRIRQADWQATLDDCQEVCLSIDRVRDDDPGGPTRTYEQLRLELRPKPQLQSESVLKRVELGPGVQGAQFRFEEIEVRADESRRRVWFVDGETGRVVATLDRDTGATTGPDDVPPPWAIVGGGIVLEVGK